LDVSDEAENAIDDCVAKCPQVHERCTSAQLLDKLALKLSLSQDQVKETFERLLHAGLVAKLCHQVCVPGYGAPLEVAKEDGAESSDLTHNPNLQVVDLSRTQW
jgi:hypothetical protein